MALSVQARLSAPRVNVTRSRRVVVRVSAFTGESSNPFSSILRIFAPNSLIDTKEDFPGAPSGYKGNTTGKIRRPFKDGYMGTVLPTGAAAKEKPVSEGVLGYLNAAAQRVVSHNFKGDDTEPDWKGAGVGYKGKVRKSRDAKNKDFHSNSY